ncbi:MAG: multicopper oxidase domain-containing protein, partial [Myxococcales bacterium]|nr:multicopper oxidase domain-containing protein [Myxococcales bacterium]
GGDLRTVNPDPQGTPADPSGMNRPEGIVKLAGTSDLWWVIDNWWDTIVVPPHGYVKLRYWMNVPEQAADASFVTDDVNRSGSWVYHCHILRHEDRGMMMRVETQPKEDP